MQVAQRSRRRESQAVDRQIAEGLREVLSKINYRNGLIRSIRELGITTVIPDHILDLLVLDELTRWEDSQRQLWNELDKLPRQDKELFYAIRDRDGIYDERREAVKARLEEDGFDINSDSVLDMTYLEACFLW
jgi:hypothetical protein